MLVQALPFREKAGCFQQLLLWDRPGKMVSNDTLLRLIAWQLNIQKNLSLIQKQAGQQVERAKGNKKLFAEKAQRQKRFVCLMFCFLFFVCLFLCLG